MSTRLACPSEETLAALLEGVLDAAESTALHRHIRSCHECGLLLAALGDGAESLASQASTFPGEPPGDHADNIELTGAVGRFVITRPLGAGGMGAVYAARDEHLGRDVAVKLVRVGNSRAWQIRLLREAQAMAQLAHPNVVPVFEAGEHAGGVYIVMELVEGGTLTEWLRRRPGETRPLTPDARAGPITRTTREIIDVFLQAGQGLAAAHAAGIVHRDFKPDNVLVGPDGRARVSDFGLARVGRLTRGATPEAAVAGVTADGATMDGAFMGTPAYMAPEQMRGEPSDARADVFGFATVFYEALYGERPFAARSLQELADKIAAGVIVTSKGARRVPAWLRRELLRGLEADPSRRHASMVELVAALQAGRRREARRRTRLGAGLVAAVAAAVAIGVSLLVPRRPSGPPVRRAVAVVGPFSSSRSADASTAWLAPALGEMLASELAADHQLRVIPAERVALTLGDLHLDHAPSPAEARQLGAALGADLILAGTYASGPPLSLDAKLYAADGRLVASVPVDGDAKQLAQLAARAGVLLRKALGSRPDATAARLQASFPKDPEAARLFAEGLAHLRAFEPAPARDALARAAELAPDNPRVLAALAQSWMDLGYHEKARATATRAFEHADGLDPEQHLAVESTYRLAIRDHEKAVEVARALRRLEPDDIDVGLRLAEAQVDANKAKDALATLDELRAMPGPGHADPRIDLTSAAAFAVLGDTSLKHEAALRAAAAASASGARRVLAKARHMEAGALQAEGDRTGAATVFRESERLFTEVGDRRWAALSRLALGTVLADEGDLAGARTRFEEAIAVQREIGNRADESSSLVNLAILLRRARQLPAALDYAEKGRTAALEVGDPATAANALAVAAHIRQELGDLGGARDGYGEAIQELTVSRPAVVVSKQMGLAEVELLQGDLGAAAASCEAAQKVLKPGDKPNGALLDGIRARVALESGRFADAETLARRAIEGGGSASRADDAAMAGATLARALQARGHPGEAYAAASTALARLKPGSEARPSVATALARAEAAEHPERAADALRELDGVLAESIRTGVVEDELEARLATGEVERRAHRPAARAHLAALARDARARGFTALARRAQAAER